LTWPLTAVPQTSTNINQKRGKHPKFNTVNTEHSESLKSRISILAKVFIPVYKLKILSYFLRVMYRRKIYFFTSSIEEQSIEYCGSEIATHHVTRNNTPIHNILTTAPQLSISQKALGTLPEDDNVTPKHVGAIIHN
jgi:hypothetical protein